MARLKPPLFLARASYRKRLLWTPVAELRLSSVDALYFFGVWLILIGLAAGLAPGLSRGDATGEEDED
jgi:hypothetical protein